MHRRKPLSQLPGAGTEQPDHQFTDTIERAPHGRAHAHGFGRIERCLDGDIGAAPDLHHPHRLPRLDRRPHRSLIDDTRDQLVAAALLHHDADWLMAGEGHRTAGAAKHLGIADHVLGLEQRAQLEAAKSPFQQFLGLGHAIVRIIETVDHHDQPQPVLDGRGDRAISAILGRSRDQAIGPRHRVQQRIAVLLADLVPDEFALVVELVVVRIGLHDVPRELGGIAHRHLVAGIGHPGRVGESGLLQANLAGALGQHRGKLAFVAGDPFGQRHGGVVGVVDDHAAQQVVDADPAVDRCEHGRAARRCAAAPPCVLAHHVLIGALDVAFAQRVEDEFRRHQLQHAGGRYRLIGVLLEQHAAALGLDQDRGRCIDIDAALVLPGALDAVVGGMAQSSRNEAEQHQSRDQAAVPNRRTADGKAVSQPNTALNLPPVGLLSVAPSPNNATLSAAATVPCERPQALASPLPA